MIFVLATKQKEAEHIIYQNNSIPDSVSVIDVYSGMNQGGLKPIFWWSEFSHYVSISL